MSADALTCRGQFEPNVAMGEFHLRKPINRAAASVMAKGTSYVYAGGTGCAEWKVAQPTQPPKPGIVDLTGVRFGRFTVVGYLKSHKQSKQTHHMWLVRCACGTYSLRKHRAIQRATNADDRCSECRHVRYLKRRQYWTTHGKEMPELLWAAT